MSVTEQQVREVMKTHRPMKTISFAYPIKDMKQIRKGMIDAGYTLKETGSPKDVEGHAMTFYLDDEPVAFAMIHSNGKTYLLRAIDGLFTPQGE